MQYLENTLVKLIAVRPACLLLPTTWTKHAPLLQRLAERRNHPQVKQAIERLELRNSRLLQSSKSIPFVSHTPAGRVYRLLDSVDYSHPVRIEDLSFDCMEVIPDATQLIAVVLEWASSCYREGTHRIYLTVRLLRKWSHLGADVYHGIISYFHGMSWVTACESSIAFKITAELVRSKTFAAGRYLQWLIATGSLGHHTDLSLVSHDSHLGKQLLT